MGSRAVKIKFEFRLYSPNLKENPHSNAKKVAFEL